MRSMKIIAAFELGLLLSALLLPTADAPHECERCAWQEQVSQEAQQADEARPRAFDPRIDLTEKDFAFGAMQNPLPGPLPEGEGEQLPAPLEDLDFWTGGEPVKPVRVIDGDTIDLERDGELVRVRLAGIDAPESNQPYGDYATAMLTRLVGLEQDPRAPPAPPVEVALHDTGERSWGRIVGDLEVRKTAGVVDVEETLVSSGAAWWSDKYAPYDDGLARAHVNAQQARRGLWRDLAKDRPNNPIPPWEWRAGVRERVE